MHHVLKGEKMCFGVARRLVPLSPGFVGGYVGGGVGGGVQRLVNSGVGGCIGLGDFPSYHRKFSTCSVSPSSSSSSSSFRLSSPPQSFQHRPQSSSYPSSSSSSLPSSSSSTSPPSPSPSPSVQTTIKQEQEQEETWGERVFWMFTKKHITAPEGYNRWRNVAGSFLVQLSIGTVYAWSVFNNPLCREIGVVAPSAADWGLVEVLPIFSWCAGTLGVCTALLGPWAERWGPRASATVAGVCWSGGLLLSSYGVETHTLPLILIGYGFLGGIGWGLGYISPVSTMMRWFPDRRGLATGLALTAFGGGALLATPIAHSLYDHFFLLPTYLGSASDVSMQTVDGIRYSEVDGALREVVVATSKDISHLPHDCGAQPGVYLVGTGSVGTKETFRALACGHLGSILLGSALMKVPAEEWKPKGWNPPSEEELAKQMKTSANVHHNEVLKTPQFYLIWSAVFGNAVAGVTVISSAKTIISDTFHAAMPGIVTGSFAASYLMTLSSANMLGRLTWATISDYTGRKNAYYLFGLSVPIAAGIPMLTAMVSSGETSGMLPLGLFVGGTFAIVSFYGGLFSVLPAYLADLFGQKHVGAIHGRLLTAWAAASIVGPNMMAFLRKSSHTNAMTDLADKCDPVLFEEKFGSPVSSLNTLIDTKTVTIPQLMEIAPDGVLDPSAHLYDTTLYSMAGLLTIAVACNALIRPVDPRHHLPDPHATAPPLPSPPPLPSSQSRTFSTTTTALTIPSRNLPQRVKETDPFFEPIDPRRKWGPFDH